MSYLDPTSQGVIRARIARKQAQLELAYTALDAALDPARAVIQSYKFDSGEGAQYASNRKPEEIQSLITQLENQIQRDVNRLTGAGIVNLNLRRRR
jgi:hypothetical protein